MTKVNSFSTEYLNQDFFEDLKKELDPVNDVNLLISLLLQRHNYIFDPTTRYEKKSLFASLTNAFFVLKGKQYAVTYAHVIDERSGGYYGKKAKANVLDLWKTYIPPEKPKRFVRLGSREEQAFEEFLTSRLVPSEEHIPVETILELCNRHPRIDLSRYQFSRLLKKRGYEIDPRRIDGEEPIRCVLNVSFAPHVYGAWLFLALLQEMWSTIFLLKMIVTLKSRAQKKRKNCKWQTQNDFSSYEVGTRTEISALARAPPSRNTVTE